MYPSAHGLPATLGSDAVSVPSSGSPGVELQGVELQGTAKKPDELAVMVPRVHQKVVSSAEAERHATALDVDSLTTASFDDDDTVDALPDVSSPAPRGAVASPPQELGSTSGALVSDPPHSSGESRARYAELRLVVDAQAEAECALRELNAKRARNAAARFADTAAAAVQPSTPAVDGATPRGPGRLRRASGSILNMISRRSGSERRGGERNMAHYELYAKQLAENPVDQATVAALIVLDRKKRFYKHVNVIDDATGVTAVVGIVLAAAICQITYVARDRRLSTPHPPRPTRTRRAASWQRSTTRCPWIALPTYTHNPPLRLRPHARSNCARCARAATMTLPRIQATSPRVGTSQNHFEIAGL